MPSVREAARAGAVAMLAAKVLYTENNMTDAEQAEGSRPGRAD
jgi:hypothetical protein